MQKNTPNTIWASVWDGHAVAGLKVVPVTTDRSHYAETSFACEKSSGTIRRLRQSFHVPISPTEAEIGRDRTVQ